MDRYMYFNIYCDAQCDFVAWPDGAEGEAEVGQQPANGHRVRGIRDKPDGYPRDDSLAIAVLPLLFADYLRVWG